MRFYTRALGPIELEPPFALNSLETPSHKGFLSHASAAASKVPKSLHPSTQSGK